MTEPGASEARSFREFHRTEEMNIHQHSCYWKGSYGSSSYLSGSNPAQGVCWILLDVGFPITVAMRGLIQDEDTRCYIHWPQQKLVTSLQNLTSQQTEEVFCSSKRHPPKPTSKKGHF
ncbi:hypothetical protein AV530_015695 [Patagioenas fasciata monilis]|uniref:Uncharacterized protein n=1 Tax=Patagioenas fasciata monilis TaxID=372326 RepID=A0A1V4KIJ0_PATFA|nr:hypothetical protein AV530_015695 [Patagioenas fasciata monilis]